MDITNRKIAVLTDSCSDIPQELAEKYGIDIMCFTIAIDDKVYTERVDFTPDEYYDLMRNSEGLPKTSQLTTFQFLDKYLEYDDMGITDLLHITINSGGSSTHNNALMAKEEFKAERPNSKMKITIVDSHTYSFVQGYPVCEAAKKLRNGADMKGVVEYLNDIYSRLEVCLAAYSLKFIKKSGRISAAAAFAGELLGLKPIITLNDGVSKVINKVRGDALVMPTLVKYAKEHIATGELYMVGCTNDEQGAQLAKLLKKELGYAPVQIFKLGCAVSTNTGPDAIAVVLVGEKRER